MTSSFVEILNLPFGPAFAFSQDALEIHLALQNKTTIGFSSVVARGKLFQARAIDFLTPGIIDSLEKSRDSQAASLASDKHTSAKLQKVINMFAQENLKLLFTKNSISLKYLKSINKFALNQKTCLEGSP